MILKLDIFQTDPLKIPNAIPAPNGADRTSEIQIFIDKYESEILIDGLGILLYEEVKTAYSALPESLDNAPQRIQDLIKGKNYKVDNIDVNWEGLLNYSLLAYYVFNRFLHWNAFGTFTTLGVERLKGQDNTAVSPDGLLLNSYRSFINKYESRDPSAKRRSLYQFLNDNKSTYPEVKQFTFKGRMNQFGI